jgi:hypothetical protein
VTGGGARLAPPGDGGAYEELGAGIDDEVGIQSDLTGGGAAVLTVAMDTSPMILIASLTA